METLLEHPGYWKIVRATRAFVTFPIVAIGTVAIVEIASGRSAALGDLLPKVIIGTCFGSAASATLFLVRSIHRLRRRLGLRGRMWATEDFQLLVRDIIGVGRGGVRKHHAESRAPQRVPRRRGRTG